uniref:4Fe-4S single cluster domain-containing protein n=1 Tax=Candidatus Kentrum eta TaxID=2126337 RepID=A0A450V404_9GAMM|nr:MAG: 4Fe-4S single cluster domain-containing protein [Candidatus Kentron sp. H]VFJ99771.1 MAG: 4Fe-4S single cluster domain-containing protein [Candidatus Kentron sp. H]VFK04112.1 MAG: 4Fe-4S single cluster domain-containing protein [Candidatus Kentron sp. H]
MRIFQQEIISSFSSEAKTYPQKHLVVYFFHPYCGAHCSHCWSDKYNFGRIMDISWHRKFWSLIDFSKIKEIRISGGEPLESKNLKEFVGYLRRIAPKSILIKLYTSGRRLSGKNLISTQSDGVDETAFNIKSHGLLLDNFVICLSVDENHASSLGRITGNHNGIMLMKNMARNFISAIKALQIECPEMHFGGVAKMHVSFGRIKWNKEAFFNFLDDGDYEQYIIATEGLFMQGNALDGYTQFTEVKPESTPTLFIIPGAKVTRKSKNKFSQRYLDTTTGKNVHVSKSLSNDSGVFISDFVNLVNMRINERWDNIFRYIGICSSLNEWRRFVTNQD